MRDKSTALSVQFRSMIGDLPRLAVFGVITKKLEDCGIYDDEALITALTNHILNRRKEVFTWPDERYGDVKLSFSSSDFTGALHDVDRFLKEDLPAVIESAVDNCAMILSRKLIEDWPEQKIFERNEMQGFRDRLELRWCKGLDPLRMLLTCSREINENFQNRLLRSKAKTGLVRRHVLILLHQRACQTTMEIIALLENGLADGALARWRTLYEVGVIASLIDMHGDDIAERYLDYDCVAMKHSLDNALKHDDSRLSPSISKRVQAQINREFEEIISYYGTEFKTHYGWASFHIDRKNPRFQDLEVAAGVDALPPTYKCASFKIHAGVSGLVRNLGNMSEYQPTLAGASNAGIDEPALNTAHSLLQVTSLLYGKSNKLEDTIELAALCRLRDQVVAECRRAARRLEKDEKERKELAGSTIVHGGVAKHRKK